MINFFIPSKKTLLLIAGLVILIIILALVSLISSPPPNQTPPPSISPRSSQTTINNLPDSSSEPLPFPTPQNVYSPSQLQEDYERLNANIPLAPTDSEIRNKLIASLNNQSGVLTQTPDYVIKYIKSRNIFMVEILSVNADEAKKQSLDWFYTQGLSTQGICNLPVSLYLSFEAKETLSGQNITFNPIPEGCQ